MGAIKIRVQTADKNNSIIHTTPVHQLMPCEEKSCVFVQNKSIIKAFLTSNPCPLSSVHNIVFSDEKVISSESGEKYAQITIYKKNTILNKWVGDFDVRGQQEMAFFTGGSITLD